VHEGARTADSLEEWAREKIQQNKGFLVEKLTNEQKWQSNCLDLNIPLCIVAFLPHIMDSSDEERRVYLEIIRGVVNNFRDKPVSFLWSQAGDHQELQDQFSLYSGFPAVLLINPLRRVFSVMKSSFTEENFEEWLQDILNRKGGRRFGQYSKSLSFGNVADDEPVASAFEEEGSIDVAEGEEFASEL
jgi:protein disulfide-isomerase A6